MWGGVGEVVRIYYTYRLVGVCVVGLPRRLGKSVPAAARPTLVAAGCGKPFAMPAAESVDRRLWYVLSCCARPLARGGQPTRPARESTGTNERRGSSAAAIHARWAETECLPAPPSRPCCLVHEAGCGQLAGQALGQRRSAAHVARVAHGLAPRSAGYRAKEDGRASQLVTHAAAHAAARRRASTAANCAARFASGPAARAFSV